MEFYYVCFKVICMGSEEMYCEAGEEGPEILEVHLLDVVLEAFPVYEVAIGEHVHSPVDDLTEGDAEAAKVADGVCEDINGIEIGGRKGDFLSEDIERSGVAFC